MPSRRVITDPVKMLRAFNQSLEWTEYEWMLPEPRDGNLVEYQSTLWNYPKIMNAFFNNIVNLAFVVVNKMYFFGFKFFLNKCWVKSQKRMPEIGILPIDCMCCH